MCGTKDGKENLDSFQNSPLLFIFKTVNFTIILGTFTRVELCQLSYIPRVKRSRAYKKEFDNAYQWYQMIHRYKDLNWVIFFIRLFD